MDTNFEFELVILSVRPLLAGNGDFTYINGFFLYYWAIFLRRPLRVGTIYTGPRSCLAVPIL